MIGSSRPCTAGGGIELRQIPPRQIERREVAAPARQRAEQRRHPLGIAVVEQRHHGATLGTERHPQILDVGVQFGELAIRDRAERAAVAGIGEARRVGRDKDPLAVGVRRALRQAASGPRESSRW